MRYNLTTTSSYYLPDDEAKLSKLGFEFKKVHEDYPSKTIDDSKDYFIEFKTMEEFRIFVHEYGPIVVRDDMIEIYDDYRE